MWHRGAHLQAAIHTQDQVGEPAVHHCFPAAQTPALHPDAPQQEQATQELHRVGVRCPDIETDTGPREAQG